MTPAQCDNCRFWDAAGEECHRYAPKPLQWQFYGLCLALARNDPEALDVVGNCASWATFPTTREHHWCGEHEPGEPR